MVENYTPIVEIQKIAGEEFCKELRKVRSGHIFNEAELVRQELVGNMQNLSTPLGLASAIAWFNGEVDNIQVVMNANSYPKSDQAATMSEREFNRVSNQYSINWARLYYYSDVVASLYNLRRVYYK